MSAVNCFCLRVEGATNCDSNSSCVYFCADVYHNYNEVIEPILQLFSIITSQLLCYLSEVGAILSSTI